MDDGLRFQKALLQADRGDIAAARATLSGLVANIGASPLRVEALVVLGDLSIVDGDPEAGHTFLSEALAVAASLDDNADDLLAVEVARAHELLGTPTHGE